MIGVSIFLVLTAFSGHGIIYGPLLISMGYTIYEILDKIGFDEEWKHSVPARQQMNSN